MTPSLAKLLLSIITAAVVGVVDIKMFVRFSVSGADVIISYYTPQVLKWIKEPSQ